MRKAWARCCLPGGAVGATVGAEDAPGRRGQVDAAGEALHRFPAPHGHPGHRDQIFCSKHFSVFRLISNAGVVCKKASGWHGGRGRCLVMYSPSARYNFRDESSLSMPPARP